MEGFSILSSPASPALLEQLDTRHHRSIGPSSGVVTVWIPIPTMGMMGMSTTTTTTTTVRVPACKVRRDASGDSRLSTVSTVSSADERARGRDDDATTRFSFGFVSVCAL